VLAEEAEDVATAVAIAERVRAGLGEPVVLADRTVTISCSIGIALSHHHEPVRLLQEADMALYRAKESGRDRWVLYDQAMHTQARERLETEELVRAALDADYLSVHYQPIIDLRSGAEVASEALARIRHPKGGILFPDQFIGIAEETGLIVPLGAAVLYHACWRQARMLKSRPRPAQRYVAVNVSARQLTCGNLVDQVVDVLSETGLPAEMLCLELTETALIDAGNSTQKCVEDIKALGVSLALDDFGTGWASLSYLRRFPIDTVKIDASFVAGLGTDDGDTALVKAMIDLGRALGLTTIAEGVESEPQHRLLRDLGCDHAQGFFYGRPEPA
jgi:predicted signal transduction protein with EAL and GGDEF domain